MATFNLGKLKMARADLKRFAEVGARIRLQEMEEERRAILRTFPTLNGAAPAPVAEAPRKRRRRHHLSKDQRADISRRMKAYWASQRGEKRRKAS